MNGLWANFKKFNMGKIRGFTLAEVLITLGIIGIVAAFTLPALLSNVTQYVFASAQDMALKKITEATDDMKTNDVLAGYATTDDFVDEFSKYIKIGRRCTSAKLNECFTPVIKTSSGTTINVSTLTTGVKLGQLAYTSPTVGVGLADGTSLLLGFDPNCTRIDPINNTTSTTACMAIVYDTNGSGQPNQIGRDIQTLNAGLDCIMIGSLCVATSDITYSPYGIVNVS